MSSIKLHNVKDILDRVKQVLNVKTDTALAEKLGITQAAISTWKKRGSLDYALIITKCEGANLHWLFTGGEFFIPAMEDIDTLFLDRWSKMKNSVYGLALATEEDEKEIDGRIRELVKHWEAFNKSVEKLDQNKYELLAKISILKEIILDLKQP